MIWKILFFVLFYAFTMGESYANISVQFAKDLSSKEKNVFDKSLKFALSKLPSELQAQNIIIKIKKINKVFNENICDLNNQNIYGYVTHIGNRKVFHLDKELVKLATRNASLTFDCLHGSFPLLLKATVLHELIHFYDNKYRFSRSNKFKNLIGGKKSSPLSRKLVNQSIPGSPDPYEYKNLKEAFAVNYEYFILDSNYKCQKPAYYLYFNEVFNIDPAASIDCSAYHSVLINSADSNKNLREVVDINPARIYQVHYLHADKGKAIMSRWGHAMYRLVICAPNRATVGPECLNDISHHVVLSYRANISDTNINYIHGLFGKYSSQLFLYRMNEVIYEYTKGELRDLWSLPLNLSEQEKNQFILLSLQRFWDYRGKYYFFTNNCATESKRHLLSIIDQDKGKLKALTPRKIFKSVINEKNTFTNFSKTSLKDRANLRMKGLLFESEYELLSKAANYVYQSGHLEFKNLKKLKKVNAYARGAIYQKLFQNNHISLEVLNNLLRLEKYLALDFEKKVNEKIIKKAQKDPFLKDQIEKIFFENESTIRHQWQLIGEDEKYGVPHANSITNGLRKFPIIHSDLKADILEIITDHGEFNDLHSESYQIQFIQDLLRKQIMEIIKESLAS